jgi:hypothetical protein
MLSYRKFLTLVATAALAALATPAMAGANDCVGTIVTDKEWVYVVDAGLHTTEGRLCQAKLKSPIARHILATCPVGSYCNVDIYNNDNDVSIHVKKDIELEGWRFDSADTITKISGIYRE